MIKVVMGRRGHLHYRYCMPFACSVFTCICFDTSILLCLGFGDVNSFLWNLDNNIFCPCSTRMPRPWGTRPILRRRSRNTMCRPKHPGGCRWKHSACIARIRWREVFVARYPSLSTDRICFCSIHSHRATSVDGHMQGGSGPVHKLTLHAVGHRVLSKFVSRYKLSTSGRKRRTCLGCTLIINRKQSELILLSKSRAPILQSINHISVAIVGTV